jgi:excinuclease ABC subunit C
MRAEMVAAAASQDFEKAASLRDVVLALEGTVAKTRRFERIDPTLLSTDETAMRMLGEALSLAVPPRSMECFDISHISGTYVVASMVRFDDGKPNKDQYRRFQIKSFVGNDDFRAMEEVVGRRYRRLKEEGRPFPDLVVIDGGVGQVGAALKAFVALDLEPPPLIGLAKKEETIVFPDGRSDLNLPVVHPGLRLLQRLRDEAHRFANGYNANLRSKRIRESLLEDMEGLGRVRRAALWDKFANFDLLKAATVEELREVPGFGPKLAAEVHAFLRRGEAGPAAGPMASNNALGTTRSTSEP